MRSKGYDLDISKNLLFQITTMVVIISSIWSLTVITEGALAAPDKFGTDQLYSIADEHDGEVKLELWLNRVATSLPFHYLGSLTSICRFISIFSCFRLKPWVNWFWWVAFLSRICKGLKLYSAS